MTGEPWREVGERVFVRRHASFDLNIGLIVGDGECLVLDTRQSLQKGRELAASIRHITPAPWRVVNSHHHFDHYFGNAAFLPSDIWAHRLGAERIREYGPVHLSIMRHQHPDGEYDDVEIVEPTHTFSHTEALDVGGRAVTMRYLGRGHTDGDIVLAVDDCGVVFAGDLVEEGAPPSFNDAFPLDWPSTVEAVAALEGDTFVPGHGAVVARTFLDGQREELVEVARIAREAHADGRPYEDVIGLVRYPEDYAREALHRAYRQLDGKAPYPPPADILARYGLSGS